MKEHRSPAPEGATSQAPDSASPAGETAPERDAEIERLERALAEERANAAALRDNVEKLRFQTEILEKSYAKQLADARQRSESAERTVAELEARLAALDTSPEETIRMLAETRRALALVTAERDQLRKDLARSGMASPAAGARPAQPAEEAPADGTINRLMSDPAWLRERAAARSSHLEAPVRLEADEPAEVMIAPELVFTKRGKEDDQT